MAYGRVGFIHGSNREGIDVAAETVIALLYQSIRLQYRHAERLFQPDRHFCPAVSLDKLSISRMKLSLKAGNIPAAAQAQLYPAQPPRYVLSSVGQ